MELDSLRARLVLAFIPASRRNLFLDRKDSPNAWEADRLEHLADFLEKMDMLRECIRFFIAESYCPTRKLESDLRTVVKGVIAEEQQASFKVMPSSIAGVGAFVQTSTPADSDLGAAQIIKPSGRYEITQLGKYHNHSDNPTCYNAWVGNERHLFPHHDLQPGEEITVDYTLQPDLEQPQPGWS